MLSYVPGIFPLIWEKIIHPNIDNLPYFSVMKVYFKIASHAKGLLDDSLEKRVKSK